MKWDSSRFYTAWACVTTVCMGIRSQRTYVLVGLGQNYKKKRQKGFLDYLEFRWSCNECNCTRTVPTTLCVAGVCVWVVVGGLMCQSAKCSYSMIIIKDPSTNPCPSRDSRWSQLQQEVYLIYLGACLISENADISEVAFPSSPICTPQCTV